MKYRLGGTTYVAAISDFFIQYTMRSCLHWRIGLLRLLCKWVGPKRRLLYEPARRGQSNWITKSFIQGVTEQMHKRSLHSFYAPEGSYYLIHPVLRPFTISCVRNFSGLQFPSELDIFETYQSDNQSFRHPGISTPSQFDPILVNSIPKFFFFFCKKMVVSTPFIFPVPNIEEKKMCCCKYFNIIFL